MRKNKNGFRFILLFVILALVGLSGFINVSYGHKAYAAGSASADVSIDFPSGVSSGATVTSSPSGINCPGTCSHNFSLGSSVTFTINVTNSSMKFVKWSDYSPGCSGSDTSTSCTVSIPSNYSEANFLVGPQVRYKNETLKVEVKGSGSGTVTSSPSGISCSSGTCSHTFSTAYSKKVTYTATAGSGSVFAGWGTQSEGTTAPGCLAYTGVGKNSSTSSSRLTTSTCYDYADGYKSTGGTAVAYFNKKSSSSSSTSSTTSSSSSSSGSSSTSTSNSTSTTDKNGSPKTPTVDAIEVDGNKVSSSDSITLDSGQPLQLAGKTVPNGIVTLTIHSNPITVTTKADKKGNWSYTINGLPSGNHYVEASVKDPKTKKTSKIGKLLSFTVADTASPSSAVSAVNSSGSKSGIFKVIAPLLILVLAGAWYGWKRWIRKKPA